MRKSCSISRTTAWVSFMSCPSSAPPTRTPIPGYFFIPDGCGALMRFDEPKTYNSSTLLRVYGPDVSVQAPAAIRTGLAPTPTKKTCSSRSTARYMAPTRTGFSASSRAAKPMPASKAPPGSRSTSTGCPRFSSTVSNTANPPALGPGSMSFKDPQHRQRRGDLYPPQRR